mmetsp:Transcript_36275/g.82178  ORF Transcript_36275/g.82178 Transcript_36275/m.82178 type:complete len:352 (-) Transcript_36275:114-1169(-)
MVAIRRWPWSRKLLYGVAGIACLVVVLVEKIRTHVSCFLSCAALCRTNPKRALGTRSRAMLSDEGVLKEQLEGAGVPRPKPTSDAIFKWVDKVVPGEWGDVLDAGTGPDSLRWLASRECRSITAVTADEDMYDRVMEKVGEFLRPNQDSLIMADWARPEVMEGVQFDVVIADYLLGAVDTTRPHFQEWVLYRLRELTRPGGYLIVIGKEPTDERASGSVPKLFRAVEALRDASMILGGERPYREMPEWWVSNQLDSLGLEVEQKQVFAKKLTPQKMGMQFKWAADTIGSVPDKPIQLAMQKQLDSLRQQSRKDRDLKAGYLFGEDYAFVVRRSNSDTEARFFDDALGQCQT